jgi:hypothetical protein
MSTKSCNHVTIKPLGVAAFSLLVVGFVTSAALPIHAQSASVANFTGTASARLGGVDMRTAPAILFDPILDGGTSVAQAQLDSLGTSTAFASTPYPSASIVQLPGLIAGVTNGQTSGILPEYPLIANSNYPTKATDRREAGTVVLEAASAAADSRGNATDGAGRGEAEVSYDAVTNEVVARAETTIDTVRMSDQLTLNGVHSVATARKKASGDVERSATFDVAALTISGQRVALSQSGLAEPTGVLSPLLSALAAQGTTIETFPAAETADGVISAGLRITTTVAPPPSLTSGVNQIIVTYTIGGNAASVANRTFANQPGVTLTGAAANQPGSTAAAGTNASPIVGAPKPAATATPNASSPPSPALTSSIAAISPTISIAAFYPVLIVAAAALFALIEIFRRRGVIDP